MRFRKFFLLLFFVSLFSLRSLSAQTPGTGALTGTVKDPSGAVIPNATVTLTSVDTGQARTTMTGADGVLASVGLQYRIPVWSDIHAIPLFRWLRQQRVQSI